MNEPVEELQHELEEEIDEDTTRLLFYLNGLKYFGSIWIITTSLFLILWGFFSPSWWHTGLYTLMGFGLFLVGSPLLHIFGELVLILLSVRDCAMYIYEDLHEFNEFANSSPQIDIVDLSSVKKDRSRRRKKS